MGILKLFDVKVHHNVNCFIINIVIFNIVQWKAVIIITILLSIYTSDYLVFTSHKPTTTTK